MASITFISDPRTRARILTGIMILRLQVPGPVRHQVSFLLFMYSYIKLRREHSHPPQATLQHWATVIGSPSPKLAGAASAGHGLGASAGNDTERAGDCLA